MLMLELFKDWEDKVEQKQKEADLGLNQVEAGQLENRKRIEMISNQEQHLGIVVGKLKVILEDL